MNNLSVEFKNLAKSKYKRTENLDKLMLELYEFAKLFVRFHESYYKDLKDVTYSIRENPQCDMKNTKDEQKTSDSNKSFLKEFLVNRFVMLDQSQYVAEN